MISDAEAQGGAAIAASRLAESLRQAGHRITRLVSAAEQGGQARQTRKLGLSYPLPLLERLAWHAVPPGKREAFGNYLLRGRLDALLAELQPDVINLHNLHQTFDPRWSPALVKTCVARAPVVWTLHDMWSFTGRCVYNLGCERFVGGCDAACPTAAEYPALPPKRIAAAWAERREVLQSATPLAAVTPSRWLAREAQRGLWAGRRVEVIPYGLPLDVYRPMNRAQARAALGLEATGRLMLFAAQNLTDPRKGWPLLREALSRLSGIKLSVIGNGELPARVGKVEVLPLGCIGDERMKALIYNAADLLVHPAPADNAPLVVMEALACGLPVACFAAGGVPEMVIPKRTGWVAEEIESQSLADLLAGALDDLEQGIDLRGECRAFAEERFDFARQAQLYTSLFSSMRAAFDGGFDAEEQAFFRAKEMAKV